MHQSIPAAPSQLIGIPSRYIYLILNGTFEGWFGHTLVCQKKSSKSGLSLNLSTAWDEVELSSKVREWERTTISILLSLFSLPAISARCTKNIFSYL